MSTTEQHAAIVDDGARAAVDMRMSELVLRTNSIDSLQEWYTLLLGRGPFLERRPTPGATGEKVDGQEKASDVRLAFFTVHEGEHPYNQILALFEVGGLPAESNGPGLHHFQFMLGSLADLVSKYEQFAEKGIRPHRSSNHGPITSFYYRDPDRNIIELTSANFATQDEERQYFASETFRRNPSGVELEPEEFIARYRAGESMDTLLAVPME